MAFQPDTNMFRKKQFWTSEVSYNFTTKLATKVCIYDFNSGFKLHMRDKLYLHFLGIIVFLGIVPYLGRGITFEGKQGQRY